MPSPPPSTVNRMAATPPSATGRHRVVPARRFSLILVTLIAVHAVINIVGVAGMPLGQRRWVRMASRALKNRIVRGIRVAGSAHAVGPAMIQVEPGVIKDGTGPS